MVAFVTGGSGFIGQHFITYLTQRGVQVRALAERASAMGSVRLELGYQATVSFEAGLAMMKMA